MLNILMNDTIQDRDYNGSVQRQRKKRKEDLKQKRKLKIGK